MSHRRQIKTDGSAQGVADIQYMNKMAQIAALVSPRNLYAELGRGSSKTTDILTERMLEIVFDMPGAPCAWISDTFSNLTQNVIPTVLESLERKGYHEGTHYVVEKQPPSFNEAEKADLPDWLKDRFWRPRNRIISYKRVIIFWTGTNFTFGSLDRPSTLAGRSYVHLLGDEAKYFKEEKVATMLKGVRGYPEYARSVYYRGVTFTSDVGDPSRIGEYDWMGKYAKTMDVDALILVMKAGLVYNEAMRVYLASKERWLQTRSADDLDDCKKHLKIANDWYKRWIMLRLRKESSNFYIRASSFVNVDILSAEWFADAVKGEAPDLKTAVLSLRASLSSGDRFYAALREDHFYLDGKDEAAYERLTIRDTEDCTVLRYDDKDAPLRIGVDFGNMCSMVVGQDTTHKGRKCLRILKFLYTLAPEYVPDLGRKFRTYFAAHRNRIIHLYYDRAGNQYSKVGRSQVAELKKAIEVDGETGKRTGWTVQLMSLNQATITQAEEYAFMLKLLGEDNPRLPIVRIDFYAAKELRLSLQNARTIVKDNVVYKNKFSEKLPIADLPTKSTNPSDAFKYFCMSKDLMAISRGGTSVPAGNLDPILK